MEINVKYRWILESKGWGAIAPRAPLIGPILFNFMQFLLKYCQSNRLVGWHCSPTPVWEILNLPISHLLVIHTLCEIACGS